MSLTMRALEIYFVRVTALVNPSEAHVHRFPFAIHIKFRDIKLYGMTHLGNILIAELGLPRCTGELRADCKKWYAGNRSRIRMYGVALFSTVHSMWRKKRMDADRIKSNRERLDERLCKTETVGGTVSGEQIRTFPHYMRRKF